MRRCLALVSLCAALAAQPTAQDLEWFERKVRPVLAERCYRCHGPEIQKSGLSLNHLSTILLGGARGPSLLPGKPDESRLVRAVRYGDTDLQMPPKGRLPDTEIGILEEWVRRGAPWPDEPVPSGGTSAAFDLERRRQDHWAWRVPRKPPIPQVRNKRLSDNPIDAFILAGLAERGLKAGPIADRRALIRRASYIITGLPPTPDEVMAFEKDQRPDAYAQLVDRLLASPRFGERWARHWLDLVRYAESYGHEFDYRVPHPWPYRDYVIRAFNADVPYDQFVREHVAGDLLDKPRRHPKTGLNESIIGTGFWHFYQATHAPVDVRQDELERMDNQIDVLTKTFLGMTVSCARCHDHKFDAISTADFYALCGYLQSSRRQIAYLDPEQRIATATHTLDGLQQRGSELLRSAARNGQQANHPALLQAVLEALPLKIGRKGRIESEDLKKLELTGGRYQRQDWKGLSGNRHMLWTQGKPGSRLVLEVEVPRKGRYELKLVLTKARDYGIVKISLDDQVLAANYDLYNPKVVSTKPIELGQHELKKGQHRLAFEIVGAHPDAIKSHMVGIDWLSMEPVLPPGSDASAIARRHGVEPDLLDRWLDALQDPALDRKGHPLHHLREVGRAGQTNDPGTLSKAVARAHGNADATRSRGKQAREKSRVFEAFDGTEFDGWFVTGHAFGNGPTSPGELSMASPTGQVPPAGVAHSAVLSRKHQGALRSPTFTIESPHIWYRIAGEGGQIRLIIDGYIMDTYNALLFGGMSFKVDTKGQWRWHDQRGDVAKFIGHRAWIEILDDGNGWVAVDQIVFSDHGPPPDMPGDLATEILGADLPATYESVATGASRAIRTALAAVANRSANADQSAVVDWMFRQGLLEAGPSFAERLAELRDVGGKIPGPLRILAMSDGTPEDEYVFIRGDHQSRGPTVPRRFLTAIVGPDTPSPKQGSGRRELAEWILSEKNPLPARVVVNRVFHHVFGRGIVPSTDNFGVLGEPPSHPELLDWLAVGFREDGWSIKRLIRRLLLTRTFRQSSAPTNPETEEHDPGVRWLHRMRVRRLEGEAIRDALLAVSGRLDTKMYGPSIPIHLTAFMTGRGRPGGSGPLDGKGRRTVYLQVLRNFLNPMMTAFDMPLPFTAAGRRSISNVPAQALTLMNDPLVIELSRSWAKQTLKQHQGVQARIEDMFHRAFARPPQPDEIRFCRTFLEDQSRAYGAKDLADHEDSWADLAHVLFNSKEFIFID